MKDDRTQAIAARAYELWERSGRPRGQHEAHWRQAEEEIGGAALARGAANGKAAKEAPEIPKRPQKRDASRIELPSTAARRSAP